MNAKIRRGNLEYQRERAAATAAPTKSFLEKKRPMTAPIFDELSRPFDKTEFAVAQAKIKAEKVRFICTLARWH